MSPGGENYLARLDVEAGGPLIRIGGAADAGKGELIANYCARRRREHPKDIVFDHYLAASADSASAQSILRRLWSELNEQTKGAVALPDGDMVFAEFPERLARAEAIAKQNGRVHRWLFHHILSQTGYNPPGVVFPISSTIYRRIDEYRRVLKSYSQPLLELVDWKATSDHNVEVLNETADYYRYFDATAHAEFLYECVQQTVERDLPDEVAYLEAYDRFTHDVLNVVDMPNSTVDLLHRFLKQNDGQLLAARAHQGICAAYA